MRCFLGHICQFLFQDFFFVKFFLLKEGYILTVLKTFIIYLIFLLYLKNNVNILILHLTVKQLSLK